jgi:aryl-alcohol dehydrogenase
MTENCCTTYAAVSEEDGQALLFRDLVLDEPRQDEVRVKVVATGICHTDVAMRDGPRVSKPVVLGHEGAGIVEAVGASVRKVKAGDHVIMSFMSCGNCSSCLRGHPAYCRHTVSFNFGARRLDGSTSLRDGERAIGSHFFGQSSFATHVICYERNVVQVPDDLPLERLGPWGCGLQTGAGAILNSLKIRPGESLAVLGVGSVGLAAVMAASIAGASRIVAVDVHEERLQLAASLGATDHINASSTDVKAALLELVPGGVDAVVDTSGHIATVQAAIAGLAPLGRCGLISSAKGAELPLSPLHLMTGGRVVMGIHEGDSVPGLFIPQLIEYHRQGRFPFDRLLRFYPFERINDALEDLAKGRVLKPVIRMP